VYDYIKAKQVAINTEIEEQSIVGRKDEFWPGTLRKMVWKQLLVQVLREKWNVIRHAHMKIRTGVIIKHIDPVSVNFCYIKKKLSQ
jgi:hypothetical protein